MSYKKAHAPPIRAELVAKHDEYRQAKFIKDTTIVPLSDIEESFKQSLDSIGHPLAVEMKFDTQNWQRFDCPLAAKGNLNVAYKCHSDGRPVLKIQCNKCHPKVISFKFGGHFQFTPIQRQEMQVEVEKRRAEQAEQREAALKAMRDAWDNAKPCLGHPYFARKALAVSESDGLRLDALVRVLCPVRLLSGALVSLQSIPLKGIKKFYASVSPKNGFHVFGSIEAHDEIFFGEGVATCLSIKNAVQKPVICVYGKHFDSIAPIIAKAYPNKQFIYCCDLPSAGEKVTSEDNARKAIALVGGSYVLPDFSMIPADLKPEISRSDFNDLYCLFIEQGKTKAAANDILRQQIQNSIQHGNNSMNGNSTQKENAKSEDKKSDTDPTNDSGSTDGGKEPQQVETEQERTERETISTLAKIDDDLKREREIQVKHIELGVLVGVLKNAVKKERKRIENERRQNNRGNQTNSTVLDRFEMTESGLIHSGKINGERIIIQVTKRKFEIEGRQSDYYSNGGFGLVLKLVDENGTEKRWAMPSRLMSDLKSLEAELNDLGMYVFDVKKLVNYLKAFLTEHAFIGVNQMGWHVINNENYFVLDNEIIGYGKDKESIVYQSQFHVSVFNVVEESLESWQNNIGRLCVGNNLLIGVISHELGATIIQLTNGENFAINAFGVGSIGKSTTDKVRRSTFGTKKQEASATPTGIELTLFQNNDMCTGLEELHRIKCEDLGNIAYMIGNGTGKTRGNANITLKPTLTFRGHCFFTANISAEQHIKNSGQSETGGHMVRILDIPAFGKFGVFENLHEFKSGGGDAFSKKLQEETFKKHGALGREFIKRLIKPENRKLITELYEEIRTKMLEGLSKEDNGQVGRTINNFAKNAAAFEAAIQFGLLGDHFKKGDGIAANITVFNAWINNRGGIGNHESRKIINDAKGFISKHGASRFQLEGKGLDGKADERTSIPGRLGFKKLLSGSWVYYLSNEGFKELCGEENTNYVREVLAEAKIIEKKPVMKNGKPYFEYTQSLKFCGEKKARYVVFTGGTDLENEDELERVEQVGTGRI